MIYQSRRSVVYSKNGFSHSVKLVTGYERSVFGRGQIIKKDPKSGVYQAGSDPHADGLALGY